MQDHPNRRKIEPENLAGKFSQARETPDEIPKTLDQTNILNRSSTRMPRDTESLKRNAGRRSLTQIETEDKDHSSWNSAQAFASKSSPLIPNEELSPGEQAIKDAISAHPSSHHKKRWQREAEAYDRFDPERGGVDPIVTRTLVFTLEVETNCKPDKDEVLIKRINKKMKFIVPNYTLHRRPDEE